MIILRYLLLYLTILSGAIFLADKFNKKLEHTLCINILGIIIMLYISGIVGFLKYGVIIVCAINILLLIYTLIKNLKNKTIKELGKKISSVGTMFFTLMFFVLMITSVNRELPHWDHFSYWSIATKDMFYTDSISLNTQAVTQYPPVPTVLQYFFMKIIGEYRQGIEAFAIWILGISMFLPFFEKTKGKKTRNLAICLITLCIPAAFRALYFYETALPDALIGIIIGYVYYTYIFEKDIKIKNISILMALIVLTLTKAMGLIFAAIIVVTLVLYEILMKIANKENKKNILLSKELRKLFVFLIIILIVYTSWVMYLKNTKSNVDIGLANSIEQDINTDKISTVAQGLITTVLGKYQENNDAAQSIGGLIEGLQYARMLINPFPISIMGLTWIYVIIALIYYYKTNKENKNIIKNITISLLIGLILYIGALQLAYIAQFSPKEMIGHDGLDRYVATYMLAILYLASGIAINEFAKKDRNLPYVILTVIILTITPLHAVANATITSGIYNINQTMTCNVARFQAKDILEQVNNGDKVLGLCPNGDDEYLVNLMIRYYMYPIDYEISHAEIRENNKLRDILKTKGYDYVYVVAINNEIETQLEEILGTTDIETKKLYKIEKESL